MSVRNLFQSKTLATDAMASVVVFLVALPLCLGIAIASGAPPALGLITGIIGGLVVGFIGGAPLQVSGPAAGLTVIVWDLVQRFGLQGMAVVVLLGGLIQIGAAILRGGRWFQAVPPSLVHGMLAGIGALILASQFHVMLDDQPQSSGLLNFAQVPQTLWKAIAPSGESTHHLAALTGALTIAAMVLWTRFARGHLRHLPAALVAVGIASLVANLVGMPINYISIPDDLLGAANFLQPASFELLTDSGIWIAALALAVIASAETLLSAVAVDRLHDGPRTNFDRELMAQGVGNTLCGVLGALPMTGVIVRSSANVAAGAKTRLSAILHGGWLLLLVVAAPFILELVPISALAAVLVYTGFKLINVAVVKELRQFGRGEVMVYAATMLAIVVTDLLTGVLFGLALAVLKLVAANPLHLRKRDHGTERALTFDLAGHASFLRLPHLVKELASIPKDTQVRVNVDDLQYIDHACCQAIEDWETQHRAVGGDAAIPWDAIRAKTAKPGTSPSPEGVTPQVS